MDKIPGRAYLNENDTSDTYTELNPNPLVQENKILKDQCIELMNKVRYLREMSN